jgi:hypothetical protein
VSNWPAGLRLARWIVVADNGCWLWLGGLNQRPVARCGHCNTPITGWQSAYPTLLGWSKEERSTGSRFVYRWMLRLFEIDVPDGSVPDHVCENKWCVNPGHFEIVSMPENSRRARRRE